MKKAKILAKRTASGKWTMIAKMPNGEIEYPREGHEVGTREQVFIDAALMYDNPTWRYNYDTKTIDLD